MVRKIKIALLICLFFVMGLLAVFTTHRVETNLIKTIIPDNIIDSSDIDIAEKYSSAIKVIFENKEVKNEFLKRIDKNYFEINNINLSDLLDKYTSHPENFLSYKTKKILQSKKYDEIYNNSLTFLYTPSEIQIANFDKDPYFLLNDFLYSNSKNFNESNTYEYLTLNIKDNKGFSPDATNKKIAELIKIQKDLNKKKSKVYLAGSPIHSYYTSIRSKIVINLICIFSTLLILFLTKFYFKSIKPFFPLMLSITFGILTGYIVTNLWFDSFQIITMVFSTTLIGIGFDYSYHYFFADKIDKKFIKKLTCSLITTLIPFVLLYLTGIEFLKQVCVFTTFGLSAIYTFVLFFYPCFSLSKPTETLSINCKLSKILLIMICIFSLAGFTRFKFNDTLTSLYSPSKDLQKAEKLYNDFFKTSSSQIFIIDNIPEKEEELTSELDKNNIDYISITKFLPSAKKQKENFILIKELYLKNLDNYSEILSKTQISNLKNIKFTPVLFNYDDYPYLKNNFISGKKSVIIVFDSMYKSSKTYVKAINIKSDVEKYLKKYRKTLTFTFPVVLLFLLGILSLIYGIKSALIIISPPVMAILFSLGITLLIFGEINLFVIISLFLLIGFTMDYSIFRIQPENKAEDAVFVSAITTSFSFLMLTFSGFRLLNSIAVVMFFGIITAYLAGYVLFIMAHKQAIRLMQ